jgi:two-component system phosphate regulon sensor histidine kinase PhoR
LKLGIRAKLFLISLGLIALSVLVAYAYARAQIERDATLRIRGDLVVRAELVASQAETVPYSALDVSEWDHLADRLGEKAGTRVTFIARDGRVLGDSMVSLADLPAVANHRSRPEVAEALAHGVGESRRYSMTTERDMMYVAVPLRRGGETIGVARVALAATQLDSAFRPFREVLIVSAVLALSVAVLVASLAVQVASRKARALTQAARRMAAGDLDVRTRVSGGDEFAELGNALDRLARSLSKTLGALSTERDRMSGILESMQEGVLFLDESGRLALVNPMLREMLLLSGDEVGKTLLETVRNAELKELVDLAAAGETSTAEINVSGLKPRQLLVRASPIVGHQRGVLAVFVDVTENRRLENIRREFVANVSHELRTPVTSIRSAAETLLNALESQPKMAPRFVDIIDRNAARLHELVEDLLDLSRIESRQFSLTLESVDPRSLFRQVEGLFAERTERRKITLRCKVTDETGLVLADRRALERVLTNLVDNAVKYAGEGKNVTVVAERRKDRVALLVTDDGPGIEKRHLTRLFERFYRVDSGRSRDLGGTGLGLSIVKHLVDSMGGAVRVESVVGEGTTFTVLLPRAPEVLPR